MWNPRVEVELKCVGRLFQSLQLTIVWGTLSSSWFPNLNMSKSLTLGLYQTILLTQQLLPIISFATIHFSPENIINGKMTLLLFFWASISPKCLWVIIVKYGNPIQSLLTFITLSYPWIQSTSPEPQTVDMQVRNNPFIRRSTQFHLSTTKPSLFSFRSLTEHTGHKASAGKYPDTYIKHCCCSL